MEEQEYNFSAYKPELTLRTMGLGMNGFIVPSYTGIFFIDGFFDSVFFLLDLIVVLDKGRLDDDMVGIPVSRNLDGEYSITISAIEKIPINTLPSLYKELIQGDIPICIKVDIPIYEESSIDLVKDLTDCTKSELSEKLNLALDGEDYVEAGKIRDEIGRRDKKAS